ncbi:MAG TPA: hypothetical protein VGR96_15915 [Acidobacteriaceae bacterium]|nr:hypothetical protein [Acidobacteriaceae bacterium]
MRKRFFNETKPMVSNAGRIRSELKVAVITKIDQQQRDCAHRISHPRPKL